MTSKTFDEFLTKLETPRPVTPPILREDNDREDTDYMRAGKSKKADDTDSLSSLSEESYVDEAFDEALRKHRAALQEMGDDDFVVQEADLLPKPAKPLKLYLWRPRPNGVGSEFATRGKDSLHVVIFTHGAGGGSTSDAALCFCTGLSHSSCGASKKDIPSDGGEAARSLLVLSFDGSMNLKARSKAFVAVIRFVAASSRVGKITLSGRSMGCRAAAMAFAEISTNGIDIESNSQEVSKLSNRLLLESYPLTGKGEDVRKQVLLDLPPKAEVLFIFGDGDGMMTTEALNDLRYKTDAFRARSSYLRVKEMDHGMGMVKGTKIPGHCKAEAAEILGTRVGEIAGNWLLTADRREEDVAAEVGWNKDVAEVEFPGWRKDKFAADRRKRLDAAANAAANEDKAEGASEGSRHAGGDSNETAESAVKEATQEKETEASAEEEVKEQPAKKRRRKA